MLSEEDRDRPNFNNPEHTRIWRKITAIDGKVDNIDNRLTSVETDISWLKDKVKTLDKRLWYILASVIFSIVMLVLGKVL